ncbi:nitroreductase family protein [uncultured Desulfobacter sp.]|uniref:nitroreductase family protein n=1 Tax=uncultured Desulfobacter sp. TaxID=240139 RepID=UPI0029F4B199|nr:nitroreductase family protein [uncultured Desulfobacter sp.]
MPLFKIDYDKCNKDGLCVLDCPAKIIEMKNEGPCLIKGAEKFCIRCGHCVAICPTGAFHLETNPPDACLPIQNDLILTPEQAEQFLRSRRSIRVYKKQPVPKDRFEKALSIACCAPTGSNKQPVKWLVFDKKKDVKDIASRVIDWMKFILEKDPQRASIMHIDKLINQWNMGIDRICRDAPQLVFAYASNGFGSAAADCHTALAYLELALPVFGLGSCWAGYVLYAATQWPELSEKLGLPGNHTCHGALMVGIPKTKYARAPKRNDPDVTYFAG